MSLTALRTLWMLIAAFNFVLCFDLFAATQSWGLQVKIDLPVGIDVDSFDRVPAALLGSFVAAFGVLFMCWLGKTHATSVALAADTCRSERVPIRTPGVDPCSKAGKRIALTVLGVFALLPIYALGHFLRIVAMRGLLCRDGQPWDGSIWTFYPAAFTSSDVRLTWHGNACNGVSFYPFFQPLAALILVLLALYFATAFFVSLARRSTASLNEI